jgi:hypothetical protein
MILKEKALSLEKESKHLAKTMDEMREEEKKFEFETQLAESHELVKDSATKREASQTPPVPKSSGATKEKNSPDILVRADDLIFRVDVRDKPMDFDTSNIRRQIMRVIIEVIGKGREATQQQIIREASEFGYVIDSGNCSRRISELVGMGALVKTDSGVRLPTKAEFGFKGCDKEISRNLEKPIAAQNYSL